MTIDWKRSVDVAFLLSFSRQPSALQMIPANGKLGVPIAGSNDQLAVGLDRDAVIARDIIFQTGICRREAYST
jgi:hypothetical protein